MKPKIFMSTGIERKAAWYVLLTAAAIVTVHLVAALIHEKFPETGHPIWILTVGTAVVTAAVAWFTAGILPAWLDATARRHPIKALLLTGLGALALVQTARITANRVSPENSMTILTTHPFWTEHECGTAYFYAVELNERGEQNIYLANHYPVLNRDAEPHTDIEGLKVEDAYQYPPQFLLLPGLLLAFTDYYPTIRYVWYALQYLGIGLIFLLLARWTGGRDGRWMAMLTPFVMLSPAALYAFQYTQFHFAAIAMAVGGMVAFERNRNALGGALLSFAVVGKIFPAFLIALLLAEKRWKSVAWTLIFGLVYTAAALWIHGSAPFSAFLSYHLPRLQSFAAFAFLDTWPEVRFELITANLSPYGQIIRLGEMGLQNMTSDVASFTNTLFSAGLVVGTIWTARLLDGSRKNRARVWLSILGLASLSSPAAWGDYITLPALWLLTVLAADAFRNRWSGFLWAICAAFFYLLLGTVPFGSFSSQMVSYLLATACFCLLVGVQGWMVARGGRIQWPDKNPAHETITAQRSNR